MVLDEIAGIHEFPVTTDRLGWEGDGEGRNAGRCDMAVACFLVGTRYLDRQKQCLIDGRIMIGYWFMIEFTLKNECFIITSMTVKHWLSTKIGYVHTWSPLKKGWLPCEHVNTSHCALGTAKIIFVEQQLDCDVLSVIYGTVIVNWGLVDGRWHKHQHAHGVPIKESYVDIEGTKCQWGFCTFVLIFDDPQLQSLKCLWLLLGLVSTDYPSLTATHELIVKLQRHEAQHGTTVPTHTIGPFLGMRTAGVQAIDL